LDPYSLISFSSSTTIATEATWRCAASEIFADQFGNVTASAGDDRSHGLGARRRMIFACPTISNPQASGCILNQ
jgi:hypothetical protein